MLRMRFLYFVRGLIHWFFPMPGPGWYIIEDPTDNLFQRAWGNFGAWGQRAFSGFQAEPSQKISVLENMEQQF